MAQRRAARGSKAQSHGDRTRARLIEVAGQVFAERGVHAATGQQICRRAGANAAAIVYHFGGMAGLYRAVLAEAQQRLVSTAALAAAVAAQRNPALKLQAFLGLIVQALASPASRSWAGKLFGRELVSPSAMFGRSHDRLLRPRAAILRSIAAELCGRAPQDPAVARACLSIMAPCVVLLLVDHGKMRRVFPQLRLRPADAPRLTQHLTVFALAGLRALRLSHTPAVRAARG
jgi:AcrR family transcriptional regulator